MVDRPSPPLLILDGEYVPRELPLVAPAPPPGPAMRAQRAAGVMLIREGDSLVMAPIFTTYRSSTPDGPDILSSVVIDPDVTLQHVDVSAVGQNLDRWLDDIAAADAPADPMTFSDAHP